MAHAEFRGAEAGQVARGFESRVEHRLVADGEFHPHAAVRAREVGKLEHAPIGQLVCFARFDLDAVAFQHARRGFQGLAISDLPSKVCDVVVVGGVHDPAGL